MNNALVCQLVNLILPEHTGALVERVPEGGSTEVYRIRAPQATYYLRVLPEVEASFAPEVGVHRRLSAQGLHVPEVCFFAHDYAPLQRSVMLTTEVPGKALGHGSQLAERQTIVRQAGRELAQIGQIKVAGFGWIDRTTADTEILRAAHATFATWIKPEINQACAMLAPAQLLSNADLAQIRLLASRLIEQVGDEPAILAHGDFDLTHIYHQAGVYSGIIDFGEIRGANRLYDLGHFQIENRALLPDLMAGYREISPLAHEAMESIMLTGLVIAVGRLASAIGKGKKPYPPYLAAVKHTLAQLAA